MSFNSFFRILIDKVVGTVSNFFNSGATSDEQVHALVSNEMSNAIDAWINLYVGKAPWLSKNKQSLGLPASIASELARLVTLEMKAEVKCPATVKEDGTTEEIIDGSDARANYLNEQLKIFLKNIRVYCEYGCAGGGLMIKPYVIDDAIAIDCVKATDFLPLAYDSKGKITACIFAEHKKQGIFFYHRIEKHEFDANAKKCVITNTAYRSYSANERGTKVSLKDVPEWSNLQPRQEIANVSAPLYAYFRIPLGNTIDPSSPLGVSVYARAVNLIEDADRQYQRLLWEFEGGELAIDAGRDVFPTDKKGEPILPEGKERLFRPNSLDAEDSGNEIIKVFSPTLRDASINNGLNAVLQKVEFNSGLAYGTLSDLQNVDKTAEEIKTSKQRSYSTVTDIQGTLQTAIEELVCAMDTYTTLYNLAPLGKYEVDCVWDDSIVVDTETERSRDMNEVRMGLMQKWEYRVKWYGEDEDTAKEIIAKDAEEKAKAQNAFGLT